MISLEILDQLVPISPYRPRRAARIPTSLRTNSTLMNLARWEAYLYDQLSSSANYLEFFDFNRHSTILSIGIAPVGRFEEGGGQFPVVEGYRFGVIVYGPVGAQEQPSGRPYLDTGLERIPIMHQTIDLIEQSHPSGGRSAAVVSKNNDEYLLTAGHVVAHLAAGASITLNPNSGFSSAPLHTKAIGCVDAALIGPLPHQNSRARFPLGKSISAYPTVGQTIDLCLASSTNPIQATVMQSFVTMPYITVMQPNNFLFDQHGVRGDSGSAIISQASEAIGMYLGQTNVVDRNGNTTSMGFGLDIEQCLDIFGVKLKGAIL